MTLDDLRDYLRAFNHLPGDTLIVISEDSEGNGYSPLSGVSTAAYLAESSFSGEHYMTEEQRQAMDDPDEYFEAPEGAVPAIFLWPTN